MLNLLNAFLDCLASCMILAGLAGCAVAAKLFHAGGIQNDIGIIALLLIIQTSLVALAGGSVIILLRRLDRLE